MKAMAQPMDCLKYTISPCGDRKAMKARAASLRFRIRKLEQGRRAAEKLASDFDRAIERDMERLDETTKNEWL